MGIFWIHTTSNAALAMAIAEVLAEQGEFDAARRCLQPYAGVQTRNSLIALAYSALAADPGETDNLYRKRPEQARRLREELEALDPFVEGPFGEGVDEEIIERLRSLGYVGG